MTYEKNNHICYDIYDVNYNGCSFYGGSCIGTNASTLANSNSLVIIDFSAEKYTANAKRTLSMMVRSLK